MNIKNTNSRSDLSSNHILTFIKKPISLALKLALSGVILSVSSQAVFAADAQTSGVIEDQDAVICPDNGDCPNETLPEAFDNDGDGIGPWVDNCPNVANPGQWDKDKDGIGNACDDDIDGDGCANDIEIAWGTKVWQKDSSPISCVMPDDTTDSDEDGVFDHIDNCPNIANQGQWDKDNDGIGNVCDDDIDGDGCANDIEIAIGTKAWLSNSTPKTCEMPLDSDADGIADNADNCPTIANQGQWDRDKDGIGNRCDHDVDGDGFSNALEHFMKGSGVYWHANMWSTLSYPVMLPQCATVECDQQAEIVGASYAKWQALDSDNYTFTYESFPYNCPVADALPPVNIRVENGLVVRAESPELGIVYENLALEPWPTIDVLYSALATHVRILGTSVQSVDFSSTLGILSQFEIEESPKQCNGGKSIRISNFKPIEEEGNICTTHVQTSFDLKFKLDNAEVEGTAHCDGQVVVKNEQGQSFFLDRSHAKTEDGVTTCSYYGVDEMPGTYSLSAKFAGFDALIVEDIVVGANICHVEPHQETYTLQVSEQECHDGYDLLDGKCTSSFISCEFPLFEHIYSDPSPFIDPKTGTLTGHIYEVCVDKCELIEGINLDQFDANSSLCPHVPYP